MNANKITSFATRSRLCLIVATVAIALPLFCPVIGRAGSIDDFSSGILSVDSEGPDGVMGAQSFWTANNEVPLVFSYGQAGGKADMSVHSKDLPLNAFSNLNVNVPALGASAYAYANAVSSTTEAPILGVADAEAVSNLPLYLQSPAFMGPLSGLIDVDIHIKIDGSFAGNGGYAFASASADFYPGEESSTGNPVESYAGLSSDSAALGKQVETSMNVTAVVNGVGSFLDYGGFMSDYGQYITNLGLLSMTLEAFAVSGLGYESVNALNTMYVADIDVTDSAGNPIPGISVVDGSGFSYPVNLPSNVPEPSAFVLAALGAMGFVGYWYRRKNEMV